MMNKPIIPHNRLPLLLFWFLIDNAGAVIPYHRLGEISESYDSRVQSQMAISKVRPFLEMNGFALESERNIGYLCYAIGKR
jgi:hypothetical protein